MGCFDPVQVNCFRAQLILMAGVRVRVEVEREKKYNTFFFFMFSAHF